MQHHTYYSPTEAARFLKLAATTLAAYRHRGEGPKFLKLGDGPSSPVIYRGRELSQWRTARKRAMERRRDKALKRAKVQRREKARKRARDRARIERNFYTTAQVAEILQVAPAKLHQWRRRGEGPPVAIRGRPFLYKKSKVHEFHEAANRARGADMVFRQEVSRIWGAAPHFGIEEWDAFMERCGYQTVGSIPADQRNYFIAALTEAVQPAGGAS